MNKMKKVIATAIFDIVIWNLIIVTTYNILKELI